MDLMKNFRLPSLLIVTLFLSVFMSCTNDDDDIITDADECVDALLGDWVNIGDSTHILTFTDNELYKNGDLNSSYEWIEDCKRLLHKSEGLQGVEFESTIHSLTEDSLTFENFSLIVSFSKL